MSTGGQHFLKLSCLFCRILVLSSLQFSLTFVLSHRLWNVYTWTTCMKSKLDFNGSDKYEARHEGEFWRWLIDVKGPYENFISLFTSLMQLVLLQHMCNFYWTQYVLTITMTRMFFRPYKSEPADLSSPWASRLLLFLLLLTAPTLPKRTSGWLMWRHFLSTCYSGV